MYTYRVLSKIPSVVTAGALLLGGIWWITNRREEVAKAEKDEE
jgi:formate dehydrogenase iron-sulfur subunit